MFEGLKNYLSLKTSRPRGVTTKITPIESLFGGLLGQTIEAHQFTSFDSYLKAGSEKVWATFCAIHKTASVVMETPWELRRVGADGKPTGAAVANPPLVQLLQAPNPNETWPELIYKWVFHMGLTGNSFWLKDEANIAGDKPRGLYTLNPKRIRIVTSDTGLVEGYVYNANGQNIPLMAEEVIHFRRPHPDNDFWGIGDIESGKELFNDHINRGTWSSKFWTNGAAPSGIMVNEDPGQMDPQDFKELKKKWAAEYGGKNNSGKTAFLSGKWKYQQLGLSAADMQNIEQSQWTVEQIFLHHGVPLSVAGIKGAANYATAEIDDKNFRLYTCKPLLTWLAASLNRSLVPGYAKGHRIFFNIGGLANVNQLAEGFAKLLQHGVVTPNEVREALGMQRVTRPEMDDFYVTAALTPIEMAGAANQDTEAAAREITAAAGKPPKPPKA